MRDPYSVLGVSRKASPADIKSAFRKLAKQYHPDVAGDSETMAATFQEINAAYDILGDPVRRTQFDKGEIDAKGAAVRSSSKGKSNGQGAHAETKNHEQRGAADAWAARARAGNRKPRSTKSDDEFKSFSWARRNSGEDEKAPNNESVKKKAKSMADDFLEDLIYGKKGKPDPKEKKARTEPRFEEPKSESPEGDASPKTEKKTATDEPPAEKKETSKSKARLPIEDSHFNLSISFQEAARGTARRVKLPNGKRLDVKIPAGVKAGQQIRLKGQGQTDGDMAGDAIIEISVEPHPNFTTEGDDIYLTLPVTVDEAVLGAKVMVPTLDGPVTMTVPPGSNADTTMRLKGRGLPCTSNGAETTYGNQYVILKIVLPNPDDQAFVDAIQSWANQSVYDVRANIAL